MAISPQELAGLQAQLDKINSDLLEYSEEEHHEVEMLREKLRNMISFHQESAQLAIIATTLEISIQKALQ